MAQGIDAETDVLKPEKDLSIPGFHHDVRIIGLRYITLCVCGEQIYSPHINDIPCITG